MPGFEETKLLRHPTVERAYNVMRTFFQDGDDFALQAIRAGEVISESAVSPDPDAIAASILMNGMIIAYEPGQFSETVSPKAAAYLRELFEFDFDNPEFSSDGVRQAVLAQSIVGTQDLFNEIAGGRVRHSNEFHNIEKKLSINERSLAEITKKDTTEPAMVEAALKSLSRAKTALETLKQTAQAGLSFDKAGLPDHPTIRAVYEHLKAWDLDAHPLGGYTQTNTAIAKIIVETQASSDPDVIAAALLNQYGTLRNGKAPSEFSPRIGELYSQSSPWANLGGAKKERELSDDAKIIRHAAILHFFESLIADYNRCAHDNDDFDAYAAAEWLERIEDMKIRVATDAAGQTRDGLRMRMLSAVAEADALINLPENTAIRAPGSPKMDLD